MFPVALVQNYHHFFIFNSCPSNNATNQQKLFDLNLKTQVQQVRFNNSIPPLSAQEPTPMEVFLYHSQAATFARGPGKINESRPSNRPPLFTIFRSWFLEIFTKPGRN